MSDKTTPRSIQIGHRVQHSKDRRLGFVVGKVERLDGRRGLLPVTIEASTRTEYWPEQLIELLPLREQFPAHGGRFHAPSSYPLNLP